MIHYWTGRGTLCSLDNNVTQQRNHTSSKPDVTCRYCRYLFSLRDAGQLVVKQDEVARALPDATRAVV